MLVPNHHSTTNSSTENHPSLCRFLVFLFLSLLNLSAIIIFVVPAVWQTKKSNNDPTPNLDIIAPFFPKTLIEAILYALCVSSIGTFLAGLIIREWCYFTGTPLHKEGLGTQFCLLLMTVGSVILILNR